MSRSFVVYECKRFQSIKRKFPINHSLADQLPVFDYGLSKPNYPRLYVFGFIRTGSLGISYLKGADSQHKNDSIIKPKRLTFAEQHPISHVACGFGFSLFATKDGQIYGSGINQHNQLGYHCVRKGHPLGLLYIPHLTNLTCDGKVQKLSAGRTHSAVLADSGLYLMGNNEFGQCNRQIIEDENYEAQAFIQHVSSIEGKTIVDVECGQDHTIVLTDDGNVYACGCGDEGQLGNGECKSSAEFKKVHLPDPAIHISCRSDFALALTKSGDVYGWGNSDYGQAVANEQLLVAVPQKLKAFNANMGVKAVSAGGSMCAVVCGSGVVFVWGMGILGLGPNVTQVPCSKPQQIPSTLFGRNDFNPNGGIVTSIQSGIGHFMAITNTGDLYAWGRNSHGCLGLCIKKDQYFPFKVAVGARVTSVYCGVDHTIVMCKPII